MTIEEKLTQVSTNDNQIHTNDLEAKGEITALLQYANGVTGEQDTRIGDAVYRLAEGYGQGGGLPWWWEYANGSPLNTAFDSSTANRLPETISFDLRGSKIFNLGTVFNASSTSARTIEIIYPNKAVVPGVNIGYIAGGGGFKPSGIKTIRLRQGDSNVVTLRNNAFNYFANSPTVEIVDCIIDLSLFSGNVGWTGSHTSTGLAEIRFMPNCFSGGTAAASNTFNFSQSPNLSTDSLCSIVNAVKAASGRTLTLHATSKTNANSIVGRVEQRTDDTGAYDFFVQDDSGTMTLTNFITSVKGWTIA